MQMRFPSGIEAALRPAPPPPYAGPPPAVHTPGQGAEARNGNCHWTTSSASVRFRRRRRHIDICFRSPGGAECRADKAFAFAQA